MPLLRSRRAECRESVAHLSRARAGRPRALPPAAMPQHYESLVVAAYALASSSPSICAASLGRMRSIQASP